MRLKMLTKRAPFCIGAMAKKGTLSQHFVGHENHGQQLLYLSLFCYTSAQGRYDVFLDHKVANCIPRELVRYGDVTRPFAFNFPLKGPD